MDFSFLQVDQLMSEGGTSAKHNQLSLKSWTYESHHLSPTADFICIIKEDYYSLNLKDVI